MTTEISPEPTAPTTTWNEGLSGMTAPSCAHPILALALKAQLRRLCDSTEFVVEADEFARFQLNRQWHEKVDWEFDPRCYKVDIGTFAGFPVTLNLQFTKLNGKRIMFYSPSSQVVDYEMIDQWLQANCNPTRFGGLNRAHVDASNFMQVIDFVRHTKP